ncbi:hypothetical protein [Amycolatopsis plumensis]|uniref:Uncharacterized protein n=1 Tax=Amycolatopsis plumensis TaxID=236508 RepID=A0ABV5UD56_9PSEU
MEVAVTSHDALSARGGPALTGSKPSRRHRVSRALVLATAPLVFIALCVAPARAGSARIERDIFLSAITTKSDRATVPPNANPRSIYLAAGNYVFSYDFYAPIGGISGPSASRRIYLAEGTYSWRCVIEGTGFPLPNNYRANCYLSPAGNTDATASILPFEDSYVRVYSNTYHWVGDLQQV